MCFFQLSLFAIYVLIFHGFRRTDVSGWADPFLWGAEVLCLIIKIKDRCKVSGCELEVAICIRNSLTTLLLKVDDVAARLVLRQGKARFIWRPFTTASWLFEDGLHLACESSVKRNELLLWWIRQRVGGLHGGSLVLDSIYWSWCWSLGSRVYCFATPIVCG